MMRGRISQEKLMEAKAESIRLAKEEHLKPKAIAPLIGYRTRTVQNWLREARKAGLLKSTRDLVIEMDGQPADEIARTYGLSLSRVWAIQQEHRGYPAKPRPTPEQNVELFLEDPCACVGQPFTTTKPFGDVLVRRCNTIAIENPHNGLTSLKPAIQLFRGLTRSRSKRSNYSTCHFLQAQGIKSYSYSKLGKHEDALQLIDGEDTFVKERCGSCSAEYYRHRGYILFAWSFETKSPSRSAESLVETDRAIDLYRTLNEDHDLHNNGLAHCYLYRTQIRYYTQGPSAAMEDVRTGLSLMNSSTSKDLHQFLLHALAAILLKSGDPTGLDQARQIVREQLAYFGDAPTVPSMLTRWLMGLVESKAGDTEAALFHFEDAIDCAVQLRLQGEVAAIASDLAALNTDPRNVLAQIEGLGYVSGVEPMPTQPPLPMYLNPSIRAGLMTLYHLSASRNTQEVHAFSRLLRQRAEAFVSDGGNLLPSIP